jgi:thioredoxin-related protein
MKKLLAVCLFFFIGLMTMNAQDWHQDINDAKEEASTKNRPIVLVFQGSDWCAPCIKLDREIFQSETFKLYAEDHFVMLEADFPRKKKNALPTALQEKNNALAEAYNKSGIFPFVVMLDENGTVLGETGYMKTSPSNYILHLESFNQ